MERIIKCSVVIFDDFNNVLLAERGKGKNVIKTWGLFGKEVKGKETLEKCISKAVDKDIKCTLFDMQPFNEYQLEDSDGKVQVFLGNIKEYITTHKTINKVKWVGKKEIDNYNLNEEDRKIIVDFFNRD